MLKRILFSIIVLSALIGQSAVAGRERSIAERIAARDFPSVFQAWSPADNLRGENELVTAARHDLLWHGNLGKPTVPGAASPDGTIRRQFKNGTAVYNPMGNKTVTIAFDQPKTSAATGQTSKTHTLKSPDGDIYLKAQTNR